MRPRTVILTLGFAFAAAVTWAAATLPSPLQTVQPGLQPVGAATLHWFGLHVYDIALYAEGAAYATNGTAALSIRYNIRIKHKRLLETTLKEWVRLNRGTRIQREQWTSQLETLWPDVKPGDSLTAFVRRDGPTQFYFGDRLLGDVADPAFGPAFLAIWLDADCRYAHVRDELLGVPRGGKKGP